MDALRDKSFSMILAALGVAGVALVWIGTHRYGPGVTPDGAMYLAAAEGLWAGTGMVDYDGTPMVYAPPLFPALLALLKLVGVPFLKGARLVNALAFGGVVMVASAALRRHPAGPAMAGAAAVLFGYPLLQDAVKVLTEPLFVLLAVAFLYLLPRHLAAPTPRRLAVLTGLVALALLQRYTGVVLLAVGFLMMAGYRAGGWRTRLRDAALFVALAVLPVGLWMLRNLGRTGTATGNRGVLPATPWAESLSAAVATVTSWAVPPAMPMSLRALLFGAAVAGLVYAVCRMHRPAVGLGGEARRFYQAVCGFIGLYFAFIVVAAATGIVGVPPDSRLLAPLYVPLVWLGVAGAAAVWRGGRLPRRLVAGVMVLWLCYPVITAGLYLTVRAEVGGGGYNVAAWQASPVMRWLRANPPAGVVYSNAPGAVYFYTGRHAHALPPGGLRRIPTAASTPVLVWFDDLGRGQAAAVQAARRRLGPLAPYLGPSIPPATPDRSWDGEDGLERRATFQDGVVYGFR